MTDHAPLEYAIRARVALVGALIRIAAGGGAPPDFETALANHERATGATADGESGWALNRLLEALTHALAWNAAVLAAEPDSDRHVRAARLHAAAVRDSPRVGVWAPGLADASRVLAELAEPTAIADTAGILARVPIPPKATAHFLPRTPRVAHRNEPAAEEAVVAVLLRRNGEAVMRPTPVQPHAMHQFELEARVDRWPTGAHTLEVDFVSVHPRDYLFVSAATFREDLLVQPLELRVNGERPADADPLGITARARFRGERDFLPTRLVGNTTLELVTFDPATALPLNMPTAALRLQTMMGELRNALPNLSPADRRDVQLLLAGVLRFAHSLLDSRLADSAGEIDERWFQRELTHFLRADPNIGARLDTGRGRAGGNTDLMLGNVVLELKVEKEHAISVATASRRFAAQTTHYGAAGDSQISLLSVLDVSAKRAPAGVMGNEMTWSRPPTSSGETPSLPSVVGVTVIRAGYPRPSDFSH